MIDGASFLPHGAKTLATQLMRTRHAPPVSRRHFPESLQYVLLRAIEIRRTLEVAREIALHILASTPPMIVFRSNVLVTMSHCQWVTILGY
jgi:hypothetical protein